MDLGSVSSPQYSNDQVAEQTIATALVTGSTTSMFNNAKHTYIAGGSFSTTTYNTVNGRSPLEMLQKRAAPNAILNTGGRADEVKCHPGTREEVIDRIEKWRDAQDSQTPPIFWLSGPAGAGKSAIVQTIAKRCKAQEVPQANFFFFRSDPSRNSLRPLLATLVCQIIALYPATRNVVADVLSNNLLILDSSLDDQLTKLIVTPLQTIRQSSSSYLRPLLLIDGLDECESEGKRSQRQILQAFDRILVEHSCPFRLLVASRDESQIRAAFNNISSPLFPLYLDEQYKPEDDIRTFVIDEFDRVRRTHPLGYTLGANWPSVKDIDDIIRKSSGQFIYASTILRFIMDSSASPKLSLTRVRGAAPISAKSKSPFSHLDAMYTFILSHVDDQEALKDILHARLFLPQLELSNAENVFITFLKTFNAKYTKAVIHSCLVTLTPIARYMPHDFWLSFHHASFSDYLLDQSRSGDYFVDVDAFNSKIQPALWQDYLLILDRVSNSPWNTMRLIAERGAIRLRQLPPGFLDILMALNLPPFRSESRSSNPGVQIKDVLRHLHDVCSYDDDLTNYKRVLRQWINNHDLRGADEPDDSKWPPLSRRYIAMAHILRTVTIEPLDWMYCALHSKTEFDVEETTLWLNDLLHCIHQEKYHDSIEEYNRPLRTWVSWATSNNIPLDGVDNLPNVQWYHAMTQIERNMTIDIALPREKACSVPETAAWLTTLLHRIHKEKYDTNVQEYDRLLQKWISWAIWNDIPLDGVDGLPRVRRCLRRNKTKRWLAKHLGLGSRPK